MPCPPEKKTKISISDVHHVHRNGNRDYTAVHRNGILYKRTGCTCATPLKLRARGSRDSKLRVDDRQSPTKHILFKTITNIYGEKTIRSKLQ